MSNLNEAVLQNKVPANVTAAEKRRWSGPVGGKENQNSGFLFPVLVSDTLGD